MYIKRHLEKKLKSLLKEWACVVITGPRQVGKSTMIQEVTNSAFNYITFDDLDARSLAQSDPKLFFQLHKPPLVIDEVQYAPQVFPYIKMIVDASKKAGQFILTGSESYKMMDTMSESLAGRTAILHMQGISQSEMQGRINRPFVPDIEKLMEKSIPSDVYSIFTDIMAGTMPAVVSGKKTSTQDYYSAYVSTYLQKDVRDFDSNINSLKFFKFITSVAARAGQILNYAGIARDSDINERVAKDWLQILERMGIIFYLHPYSNNMLKRTLKKPKLYFYDSGLAIYLTKWNNLDALITGAYAGSIFENFVVSEIMKTYLNAGQRAFIYYYRDIDAKEIDIIIEDNGSIFPIEIKKSSQSDYKKIFKTFESINAGKNRMGTGAVVCITEKLSAFNTNLLVVPVSMI